MKGLARLGILAGLVSGLWMAPALTRQTTAFALPQEQVLRQLSNVPVFMITNQQGEPLTYELENPSNQKKVQVFTFFISQQDAQAALNGLKTNQPQVGNQARISPAPLSGAVQVALESQENADIGVDIIPSRQQFETAVDLLKKNGDLVERNGQLVTKEGQPFAGGTPLFYVADINTGGPIAVEATVQENGQSRTTRFVPFYFDNTQLQNELKQAQEQRPELVRDTTIRVIMLDGLVSTMLTSDDPVAGQIQLVQTPEALQFAIQQQGGN